MIKYLLILIFVIFIIQYFALKKSISVVNNLKTFLSIILLIIILNFKIVNINFTILSILFCYIYFCFLITIPGIKNLGPSLILIKIINQNINLDKKKN